METREEHAQDTNSVLSRLVEQVGQIVGGHRVVPGLLRPVMVATATDVQSTMARGTRKSNQGRY